MTELPLFRHARDTLAKPQIALVHCLLALLGGISATGLVLLFRFLIEWGQTLYLAAPGLFASMPVLERMAAPVLGALVILLLALRLGVQYYRLGIPFVIYRLNIHHGHIPFRNTINQFVGGVIALLSGFSVGREGPSVHLGAAGASWLSQYFRLPHNAGRLLASAGIAAAIAAVFSTPLAAVLFVMEVVQRQYRLSQFLPLMIAAATGTWLSHLIFGAPLTFHMPFMTTSSALSLAPVWMICGVLIGALAAGFNQLLGFTLRTGMRFSLFSRLLLASTITAVIGWLIPDVLGTEAGALSLALGHAGGWLLFGALIGKLLATVAAIGLGIPGGIIGPLYGIGALAGAVFLSVGRYLLPSLSVEMELIIVLSMATMMAASLNAPLAALIAIVEMTRNTDVILPAMLIIVPAYLVVGQLFKTRSAFLIQMELQQMPWSLSPLMAQLQRSAVRAWLSDNFHLVEADATESRLKQWLDDHPSTVLLQQQADGLVQMQRHSSGALHATPVPMIDECMTMDEAHQLFELDADSLDFVAVYRETPTQVCGILYRTALKHAMHQD